MEVTPDMWLTGMGRKKEPKLLSDQERKCLVEDATEVWKIMRSKYNSRVRFYHCRSMKQFQLSNRVHYLTIRVC